MSDTTPTTQTVPAQKKQRIFALQPDVSCRVIRLNGPKDTSASNQTPVIVFVDTNEPQGKSPLYEMFLNGMSLDAAQKYLNVGTTFSADLMICETPETYTVEDPITHEKSIRDSAFRTYFPSADSVKELKSAITPAVAFQKFIAA